MTSTIFKTVVILIAGTAALGVSGCEVIGPKTLDEAQRDDFGKQYSPGSKVREIQVGGQYYTVYRRESENFGAGSKAKGVDYTVNVKGSVLACDGLENTVEQCIKDFEKRIPRQLFEISAREESSM
ncbi:hypothetical protein [Litoreibacter janthinus]|uniref:Lipoprotein n=1 Tax=Litoreibacter janthinus TaxID=670154 RepID=A0A1I6HZW4_9RHOB|nr:hypothetical protein [Litoreibacter janthinus]SFR59991.1 hypothetical protein SAMN04488002_3631 [Litoreibacter janthinus]